MRILKQRARTLFRRDLVERELEEELRYHLEREIELRVASGMGGNEARLEALRAMGGLEQRKEECRDARGWNTMENLLNDLRFGLRQLRRDREFSLLAVAILALGIAASVAIFAFVDAALLKPLPYQDPARLIGVYEKIAACPYCNLSWPDYLDWKRLNTTLASLDIYQNRGHTMTSAGGGAIAVRGARVSDGFFRTLGVPVALGRDFHEGEDKAGVPRTVILSHGAWQRHFGGSAAAIGKTVTLSRMTYEVVGVLPASFHFSLIGQAEFWTPFHPETECDLRRSCHTIYGVGRLRDGVSAEAALANFQSIAAQLEKQYPDSNRSQGANVLGLTEAITGAVRPVLLLLLAGAGLLLLIAIANVSGLLLVKSEGRRRETAVRTALGASSWRMMSQFATESAILVAAAGVLGIAGAHVAMRLLLRLVPEDMLNDMLFLTGLGWTPRVVAFSLAIAVCAALLFTIAPAMRLRMEQLKAGLADGARGATGNVWRNMGSKLAVLELATALVLLTGAGLLGKSLVELLRVRLGFDPERLITIDLAAPNDAYKEDAQAAALARDVLARAASLPGVASVAIAANGGLVAHNGNTRWIRIEGRPETDPVIDLPQRDVTPEYFSTIGAQLSSGRLFQDTDDLNKPAVAIVNESFVRAHLPNEQPLGKRVRYRPGFFVEIVGVVKDIRQGQLTSPIPPLIYRPFFQTPDTYFTLFVRSRQDPASVLPSLRELPRGIHAEIITRRGSTVTEVIEKSPAAYMQRSSAWIVGAFAGMALLLALVGLYGVIAYSVGQRTREIGVRMALGAQTGDVARMVLREASWLTAAGLVIGLGLAALAAGAIRPLLFGVSPWDFETLAAITAGLAVAAMLASFVPARRAASVDPVEALRAE